MTAMGFSLGGKTFDVTDDVGFRLLAGSPYFDKVAHLPLSDPDQLSSLEDDQFGVVFLTKRGEAVRKYPLNDQTNTILSNVYFDLTHEKLPPEAKVAAATKIKEASELFGVKPLHAVRKYAAESCEGNYVRLDKVAATSEVTFDGLRELHEAYVAHRDQYTREDRQKLASSMVPAAAQFGFDLHDDIKPFAVKTAEVDAEALFSQCALRKQLVQDRPEASRLLDEFVEKHASFDARETVKLLETFDRQYGLDGYWTRGLEPNLILSEKKAVHDVGLAKGTLQLTSDEIKAFAESNDELFRKMFGPELADKVKSDPGAMWSLPTASRDFLAARIEHARDNSPSKAV